MFKSKQEDDFSPLSPDGRETCASVSTDSSKPTRFDYAALEQGQVSIFFPRMKIHGATENLADIDALLEDRFDNCRQTVEFRFLPLVEHLPETYEGEGAKPPTIHTSQASESAPPPTQSVVATNSLITDAADRGECFPKTPPGATFFDHGGTVITPDIHSDLPNTWADKAWKKFNNFFGDRSRSTGKRTGSSRPPRQ